MFETTFELHFRNTMEKTTSLITPEVCDVVLLPLSVPQFSASLVSSFPASTPHRLKYLNMTGVNSGHVTVIACASIFLLLQLNSHFLLLLSSLHPKSMGGPRLCLTPCSCQF